MESAGIASTLQPSGRVMSTFNPARIEVEWTYPPEVERS
jgi:hypothetical protein